MSESEIRRAAIPRLSTGVPGLDDVLGGGLPEYSFNLIGGAPGTGKTTLAQQIMFSLASGERRALYFSMIGEPALKMLRYQQQMAYFDPAKLGTSIEFINLTDVLLEQTLDQVLEEIERLVEERAPGLVVMDSFQNVAHLASRQPDNGRDIQGFVQRLALHLTSWQATTFLLGSYRDDELRSDPVFTVADAVIWLSQVADHNSVVRKLQVVKMRGQEPMPGLHTVRLDQAGLQVFPRINSSGGQAARVHTPKRLATGVPGLDALVDGGVPAGDAILISGASGTGKSVLTAQFIAQGVSRGEPGVIAVFEEHPKEYMRRAQGMGLDLEAMVRQGSLATIYIRPLDLSPDETLLAIREAVARIGAQRVAIDSVSGFELALAPDFRQDFRESLYRLVGALTGTGITVLMTMEIVQNTGELRFSPYIISFLSDTIILLRHIEVAGKLRKSLTVVKMRNSDHSKELWLYDITAQGLILRRSLRDTQGTGAAAVLDRESGDPNFAGLTDREVLVLRALLDRGLATVAELASRTGIEGAELTDALDRLVALRYAVRQEEAGASYRAVARSL